MKRRLYFLLPDLKTAETIERELLLARVDEPHMHFLARDGVNLGKLHVANLLQRSDLLHGMALGLIAGGATGAFAGFLVMANGAVEQTGLGIVLVLALLGAIIGAWASGMIAVSIPNTYLKRFQHAIEQGQILLMVDVPLRRVREIRRLITALHPEAKEKGQESHIPAFP